MLCASHRLDTFDPLVACSSLSTWRYLDPKAVCCMDRDWGHGKFVRIWECSACRQCPWWRTGLHHLPGLCGALLSHSHLFLPRYPKIQGTKRTLPMRDNASLTQRPSFELVFEVAAVLFLIALWSGNIGSGHAHHQIAMWVWDFVNSYSPQEKKIAIKLGDSLSLVHDDHMCPLPCPKCLGVVEDVLFQGLLVGWPPTCSRKSNNIPMWNGNEWKLLQHSRLQSSGGEAPVRSGWLTKWRGLPFLQHGSPAQRTTVETPARSSNTKWGSSRILVDFCSKFCSSSVWKKWRILFRSDQDKEGLLWKSLSSVDKMSISLSCLGLEFAAMMPSNSVLHSPQGDSNSGKERISLRVCLHIWVASHAS